MRSAGLAIPENKDAAHDVGDREPIEAATARLGVVEPRERERDERCRDGARSPVETRNDVELTRTATRRSGWSNEERRLELLRRAATPSVSPLQADHGENRREDGVGAKDQLGVDQRRE